MNHKRGVEILIIVGIFILLCVISHYGDIYAAHYIDAKMERDANGIMIGAEPYYLDNGNKTGILILHGFSSHPGAMRDFADFLYSQGYTVYVPLLAGHGTSAFDLEKVSWKDWEKDAEDSYLYLANRTGNVYILGYSMGGTLALDLASKYSLKGVISISAPMELIFRSAKIWPLMYLVQPYLLKSVYSPNEQVRMVSEEGLVYDITPIKAVPQMMELMRIVKIRLYGILDEPVLIFQSNNDGLVNPVSADDIYLGVSSVSKKIVWINNSTHYVIEGSDMNYIEEEISKFLEASS